MKTRILAALGATIAAFALAGPVQAQTAPACGDQCHADILAKASGAATGADLALVLQGVNAIKAQLGGINNRQLFELDFTDIPNNQKSFKCDIANAVRPGLFPVSACLKTDNICPTLNKDNLKFRTIAVINGAQGGVTMIDRAICEAYYAN